MLTYQRSIGTIVNCMKREEKVKALAESLESLRSLILFFLHSYITMLNSMRYILFHPFILFDLAIGSPAALKFRISVCVA